MNNDRYEIRVFKSPAEVAEAARDYLLTVISEVGHARPTHVVLAGGSTPELLYGLLAEDDDIDWSNVHFWFGDERTVPPDDDESNFKMANGTLLSKIDVPPANIHRMRGEDDPDTAADDYADEIRRYVPMNVAGIPVFDFVVLGLGEDGHTASLFPDTTAVTEERESVVSNIVPQQDTVRITLTHPVLNAAAHVLFLVTGEAKVPALTAVLSGADDAPPAALIRPDPGELRWYVDEAAAVGLRMDQVSR